MLRQYRSWLNQDSKNMRTVWQFHTSGQLVFGWGAIRQLSSLMLRRKFQRVFLVTDRILASNGILDRVHGPLIEAGLEVDVFDGGEPEPSLNAAVRTLEQARRFRPDVILGLGGGSNMDLAKVTAAAFSHAGSPGDYFGWDRVPGPVVPVVCVPTTSGTGSEVSHAAVLTDTANAMKVSMLSNHLRPAIAVVDPELTLSCPPKVTADSGIDALTHAIEACTAVDFDKLELAEHETAAYEGRTPLGECLAEKAISLIGQHLVTAVREPHNRTAREGMSLAATLAGMAFSNCAVAVVHALEYPLGGELHVSHGAGNGLLLPFVMRYNLPERRGTFARIAMLLGEQTAGLDEAAAAELAISAVEKMKHAINIPQRIRDIGGREDQLPQFAAKSFAIKRLMMVNPRQPTEADLLAILQAAF
jgi:alcohol dehydrogenase class IV